MRENDKRADISIIRVLSMIMIVLCHTIKYYDFIPGNQILGQFFNVGVEIFLALSGILYGKKVINSFRIWIMKRLQKIWIPTVLLVMVDMVVLFLFFHERINVLTMIAYMLNLQGLLFLNSVFFDSYIQEISNLGPLWFTTIIMLCYFLLPVFQKFRGWCSKKNKKLIYSVVLVTLFILSFGIQWKINVVTFYIVVFLTGYLFSDLGIEMSAYSCKKVVGLLVSFLFSVGVRIILKMMIDGTSLYYVLASALHCVIGVSLLCLGIELYKRYTESWDRVGSSRLFVFLDESSFYIFLVHGIFCTGVTNVFGRTNLVVSTTILVSATLGSAKVLQLVTDWMNRSINALCSRFMNE